MLLALKIIGVAAALVLALYVRKLIVADGVKQSGEYIENTTDAEIFEYRGKRYDKESYIAMRQEYFSKKYKENKLPLEAYKIEKYIDKNPKSKIARYDLEAITLLIGGADNKEE